MPDRFDAYHVWLGIPPEEQPPNYYRLLGLKQFEDNADAIEAAVDQRMAHLRNYQTGKHSELSQTLLNQVAAVKGCLLNPQKKAKYDRGLKSRLEAPAGQQRLPPALTPGPVAVEEAAGEGPHVVVSQSSGTGPRRGTPKVVLAVIGVGVVVIGALLFVLLRNGDPPQLAGPGGQAPKAADSTPPAEKPTHKGDAPPTGKGSPDAGAPQDPPDSHDPPSPPDRTDSPAKTGLPAKRESPAAEDPPTPHPPLQQEDGPDGGDRTAANDGPPVEPESPPAQPKIAAPSAADQQKALQLIRDIHQADYDGARTPPAKLALAKMLLSEAGETPNDPAARFVLWQEACKLAAEAGDHGTSFRAVDEMDAAYEINALEMRAEALFEVAKTARLPEKCLKVVQLAGPLFDGAVAEDDFPLVNRLGKMALQSAQRAKLAALVRQISMRMETTAAIEDAHAMLKTEFAALEKDSADPEANLAVGKYYCLVKDEWQKGLPMLELGADATLKQLAGMELRQPDTPEAQAELADGWWDLAEKEEEEAEKTPLQLRAGHWYVQAGPKLGGLKKRLVENRLDTIYQEPLHALAFDGKASHVAVPSLRYDGKHPITLEAVVMPYPDGRLQEVICNYERSGLGLGITDKGKWEFAVREGRTYRSAKSVRPAAANQWTHLAGVFDGVNVALFVNGRLQPTRALVKTRHNASGMPFAVGANPESRGAFSEFFCGFVDEIRVCNAARYTQNFRPPRRLPNDGSTILLLHFDEGEGWTAWDFSAEGDHCTITGGQWINVRTMAAASGG